MNRIELNELMKLRNVSAQKNQKQAQEPSPFQTPEKSCPTDIPSPSSVTLHSYDLPERAGFTATNIGTASKWW